MHVMHSADPADHARPDEIASSRPDGPTSPRRSMWLLLLGPVAGAALGVVARLWMRLITDDPEFTWSGTIFIVGAFAVTGFGHSLALVVRSRARRRLATVARVVGAALTLPIFVGAGGMMLPTVAGASLAKWRTDWRRWSRALAAVVAIPVPVALAIGAVMDGVTVGEIAGYALLAATYHLIVRSMRSIVAPYPDGWRLARWARWCLVGLVGLGLSSLALVAFGLPGS